MVAECLPPGGSSALGVVIPVQGNPATLYVLKNKVPLALYDAQHDILLASIQDIMQRRGVALDRHVQVGRYAALLTTRELRHTVAYRGRQPQFIQPVSISLLPAFANS